MHLVNYCSNYFETNLELNQNRSL